MPLLAKPFKLEGTLTKPSPAVDTTQTAPTLGKAIGGTLLFGPVGIAAALLSGSTGEKNPCLSAIKAAEKEVVVQKKKEGTGKEVSKGIKSLFKGLSGK